MRCTFDHFRHDCGLKISRSGTSFSRTAKTWFRPKTGFGSRLSIEVDRDTKNILMNVTIDVDSKSAFKNITAVRNLETAFENRFSYLPPGGSFLLRQKGRYELHTRDIYLTWKFALVSATECSCGAIAVLTELQTFHHGVDKRWETLGRNPLQLISQTSMLIFATPKNRYAAQIVLI